MNPFIYAPPPPPPPAAAAPPPPPEQGRQGFGGNTNNRRGGGHPRGRGGFRGGNRGVSHGHTNSSFNTHSSANATPIGQPQNAYSHGLPNYPQWQQPGVTQPQAYHQPQAVAMTYPPSYYPQTIAQNTYTPPTQQPNPTPYYGYGGAQSSAQYSIPPVQPPPLNHQSPVSFNQASYMGNGTGYHGLPTPRSDFNNRKRSFSAQNSNNAAETKPEKKPKVGTAPAVPAFGADIAGANLALPARPNWLSTKGKSKGKSKGRKNNTLGLTPSSDVHEEPEEDVDEEAEFAKRIGDVDVLEFEHKGKKISIAGEAERNAYIAERRANYPTQARIAEKQTKVKAEQEARREKNKRMKREANAKKLLDKADEEGKVTFEIFTEDPRLKKAAKPIKLQDHENVKEQPVTIKAKEEVTSFEDKPSAIKVEEEASAEPTASQPASNSKDPKVLVAYLEEQLKSAPEMLVAYLTEQLKLAKEAVAAANVPTTNVVKRGDSSSSEGSSIMSESDSDSDVPPEETSIKPEAPVNVPPPRREAPTTRSKPVCLRFKKSGFCQFGKKCRYSHERNVQNQPRTSKPAPKPAIKPVRKSLHEVMVENEKKQEATRGVEVVKYLGTMDFFL